LVFINNAIQLRSRFEVHNDIMGSLVLCVCFTSKFFFVCILLQH